MTRFFLALGLLFGLVSGASAQGLIGPPNQVLCNQSAIVNQTNANSNFNLVSAISGQRIYLCGWHITVQSTLTSQTFSIVSGQTSGTVACGANNTSASALGNPVSLTPSLAVSGTAPSTDHIEFATLSTSANAQLCLLTNNVTSLSAVIWFSQFGP